MFNDPAVNQPERDGDQDNNSAADEKFGHRLIELNRIVRSAFSFLDGKACADGENTAGDADASDDEEGNEIGDTDIVGGRNEEAGDRAKNFHDDENEKNLIDDRDEGCKEGLMKEHGIEDKVNEVKGNGASDDQK